jgi:lipopolysaccharide biosynthesis glycosyltransferase
MRMTNKTTVVSICSANYLAHARTLGDSLREHNPDIHFVIGLVDRLPQELPPAYYEPFEVLPVEKLGIPEFAEMVQKYNIVELNTAIKPFYMAFLYERDPSMEVVMYLDPDIIICGSFAALRENLKKHSIVVTPHCCTYDNSDVDIHYEITMLKTGIFNLGFIATARTETTFAFLKWWQKRLVDHCYYRAGSGVFVDQQWVSLAPIYFDGVYVEKDPGYNMCYWNHFERRLSCQNGSYVVNGKHDLVFYHFSSYSPLNPDVFASRQDRMMTFAERPELRPLYGDYGRRLLAAGFVSISSLKSYFGQTPPPARKPRRTVKLTVQKAAKKSLALLPALVGIPLRRIAQFIADNSGK